MQRVNDLLCFSLYAAANAMNRIYQPLLEGLGITYPQYLVLLSLWEKDAEPVGHIGAKLGLETNTLTPLLKRMETAGLIRRSRSKQDERQVIISLAHKGRALQRKASEIPSCVLDATGLSLPQATRLRDELLGLRKQLAASLAPDRSKTDARQHC